LGHVVPFQNPEALADEIDRLAREDLVALGVRARARIQNICSVATMCCRTTDYFDQIAAAVRTKG